MLVRVQGNPAGLLASSSKAKATRILTLTLTVPRIASGPPVGDFPS